MSKMWGGTQEWVLSLMSYQESVMRKGKDILKDGSRIEILMLEVLLDIRDLLKKKKKEVCR